MRKARTRSAPFVLSGLPTGSPILVGKESGMHTKKRGELSELAFLYKATGLGFNVSKPYGDCAQYDFIVEHLGRVSKVQVKSTSHLNKSRTGYQQNCRRNWNAGTRYYEAGEVDYFAFHVAPRDTWYIVPFEVVERTGYFLLRPQDRKRDRQWGKYREAWDLLEGLGERQLKRSADDKIAVDPRLVFNIDACAEESVRVPSRVLESCGGRTEGAELR